MSLLDLLTGLRRLHDGYQRVQTMRTNYRRLQAAARFNPRSRDSWDVLQLRDSDLDRILASFRQIRRRTDRLQRAPIPVENRERVVRRAISDGFAAYANDGPDSRAATNAQTAVYYNLHEWRMALNNQRAECQDAREELKRYMKGYRRIVSLFEMLTDVAGRFVQNFALSPSGPQAFAHWQQFQSIENAAHATLSNFEGGMSRQRTWLRHIEASSARWTRF